eukprot:235867_1
MAVSSSDQLVCLVNGYLRSNILNSSCDGSYGTYEISLVKIIQEYLRCMMFKFSEEFFDSTCMELINNHHIKVIRGCGVTALIDYPMDVNDKSIKCNWNIRLNGNRFPNYHYFIGITSNRFTQFNKTSNIHPGDFTGIKGGFQTHPRILGKADTSTEKACKNKEILTVQYDGNCRELRFLPYNVDKVDLVLKIPDQIPEDITHWYPAISLCREGDSAEIVF